MIMMAFILPLEDMIVKLIKFFKINFYIFKKINIYIPINLLSKKINKFILFLKVEII
jgi:hypothetical protein